MGWELLNGLGHGFNPSTYSPELWLFKVGNLFDLQIHKPITQVASEKHMDINELEKTLEEISDKIIDVISLEDWVIEKLEEIEKLYKKIDCVIKNASNTAPSPLSKRSPDDGS